MSELLPCVFMSRRHVSGFVYLPMTGGGGGDREECDQVRVKN